MYERYSNVAQGADAHCICCATEKYDEFNLHRGATASTSIPLMPDRGKIERDVDLGRYSTIDTV